MITIQSAESALKNIYLDVVVSDINTKTNPFLTMIQRNTRTVAGKDAKAAIRYGNEGAVAAGSEDGALPVASNNKVAEIVTPLKNLYGTFQITDKAIKAAQNNAGAFASLLSGEMQNLISAAQTNLNRMVYSNGRKVIAYTLKNGSNTVNVPMRNVSGLAANLPFQFCRATGEAVGGAYTVSAVIDGVLHYTGTSLITLGIDPNERLYIVSDRPDEAAEMNGIDSIFGSSRLYNLDLNNVRAIEPLKVNGVFTDTLDEDEIIAFLEKYEEYCQGVPADILLTHPGVRRTLFETLRDMRTNVDVTEMDGGFKGFSFNGIPMYADVRCKAGTLYALNSGSWSMHQLCDWTWLSCDDGSILKQINGKAAYQATLVKYADLICDKPFIQGRAAGYGV